MAKNISTKFQFTDDIPSVIAQKRAFIAFVEAQLHPTPEAQQYHPTTWKRLRNICNLTRKWWDSYNEHREETGGAHALLQWKLNPILFSL